MGIRVVSLKDHRYSEQRRTGDAYEVPGATALRLVQAMGWAKKQPLEEAPAATSEPAKTETAAATAQRTVAAKKAVTSGRGSGYRTRAMSAGGAGEQLETKKAEANPGEPAQPHSPADPPKPVGSVESFEKKPDDDA